MSASDELVGCGRLGKLDRPAQNVIAAREQESKHEDAQNPSQSSAPEKSASGWSLNYSVRTGRNIFLECYSTDSTSVAVMRRGSKIKAHDVSLVKTEARVRALFFRNPSRRNDTP
jgi:hypothetical protein